MYAYLAGTEAKNRENELSGLRTQVADVAAFAGVLDDELATDAADKAAGMVDYVYQNTSGVITIADITGRLGKLRDQMIVDAKTVLQNGVTISVAFAGDTGNVGTLSRTSSTFFDHCMSGKIVFLVSSDLVDAPTLTVTQELDGVTLPIAPDATAWGGSGQDTRTSLHADNSLTADCSFADGVIGISAILLNRPKLTDSTGEAGDASNVFSAWTITTPAEADTNKGKVHMYVTRQATGPTFLIEWYKDAAFTQLVQTTTADTVAGSVALSMTGSKMTLAFTFNRANAAVAMAAAGNTYTTVTYDIGSPRLGDRWTMTMANDYASNAATKLAKLARISLNSGGAASADYAEAKFASLAQT
jgi:hypothetical protein